MTGWRLVVSGLVACAVVTARPVLAADDLGAWSAGNDPAAFDSGPSGSDTWSAVGWGALTGLSNLLYVPAKLAYAGLGGLTGGIALGLTGGDVETAEKIWQPSLGGDYFLTPSMIQGEDSFSFAGGPAGAGAVLPDDAYPVTPPDDHRFGG
jgi:hypothetical protein